MTRCPVCDGEDFDLHDGLYYCSECSTQSQEIREECVEEDYTEGIRNVRFVKTSNNQASTRKKKKADSGPNWRMVQAFNIILHAQADALLALGAGADFKEAVLQLWSRYLKLCEQAFVTDKPKWKPKLCTRPYARDVQVAAGKVVSYHQIFVDKQSHVYLKNKMKRRPKRKQAKPQKEGKKEEEGAVFEEDGEEELCQKNKKVKNAKGKKLSAKSRKTRRKRKKRNSEGTPDSDQELPDASAETKTERPERLRNLLHRDRCFSSLARDTFTRMGSKARVLASKNAFPDNLDMLTTLSMLCLALRMTKETILISDVTRWIKEGHIPYLQAYKLLPTEWKVYPYEKFYFSPPVTPTVGTLVTGVNRLSRFLNLHRTPILDIEYAATRYIVDMNLPCELLPYVSVVIERFMRKGQPAMCIGTGIETSAAAAILFALKHLFGLNNTSEKTLSDLARRDNLTNGSEEFFVWTEWEEQMNLVTSFIRTRQPYSLSFSARECQDVDAIVAYVQLFGTESGDTDTFSGSFKARTAQNMMSIKKQFSQITSRWGSSCHAVQTEPANGFPLRTILSKCSRKQPADFSKRKLHSARSQLYWFYHRVSSRSVYGTKFPDSFMTVFHILQSSVEWTLSDALKELEKIELNVFGQK